jgi:serine/threonine protein kinase
VNLRLQRENQAVGKLEHPNIVRAMDAGEINGTHYLAMEFVDGADLQKQVAEHGRMPIPKACKAIRQAALALTAAD